MRGASTAREIIVNGTEETDGLTWGSWGKGGGREGTLIRGSRVGGGSKGGDGTLRIVAGKGETAMTWAWGGKV